MSPMEHAFWKELGNAPPQGDPARRPARTGFVEQLDLDLHEGDVHEGVGASH
jgi:hypothetical protein